MDASPGTTSRTGFLVPLRRARSASSWGCRARRPAAILAALVLITSLVNAVAAPAVAQVPESLSPKARGPVQQT